VRFLAAGPNIPDELLEARDAGNVVFFCGAGISQPALPGFFELAEKSIVALGAAQDAASVALLNRIRDDPVYAPPLDQLFHLLQLEYGPAAVDIVVYKLLKKPRVVSTEQHSVVLRLSQNAARQPQIVTTNFDRLFERAPKAIRCYAQPALPDLASGQPLEGLVYLHGRMPTQTPDGTRRLGFVLSSADFGRAYLADGWATRFVRELLQNYVIALLGYSANDPPVRYLLEGLHSRTDKTPAAIYAFDSGSEDEVQARWRDRGVRALAYTNTDGSYSALWDSLRAWAARADDPNAWRWTMVTTLAQARPRGLQPHERGQVASLIKSDRGARLFAETMPPPPAEWLCVFDRYIRYGNPRATPGAEGKIEPLWEFRLDDDPPRPASKPWRDGEVDDDLLLSTVRPGALARLGSFGGRQTALLPDRLVDLSRWLGQQVEDPIVAWWAAGHGHLHDRVLDQIEWHLPRPDQNINERARKVWSLLVEAFRHNPGDDRWYDFVRTLNRMGWTNPVLREFERITTPYLSCTRPYSTQPLPPDGTWDELRVSEVVAFQVKFPPQNPEQFKVTSEALPAVLRILCRGLQHAAGLLADLETRHWQTATFHPEQKSGERYLDGKNRYLLRVVKLFDRLAQEQPSLARIEVWIWPSSDEFFFDKLRIYAFMNGALFSGHDCAEGLLALSENGFWNSQHRRELLHTLRARWGDFSDEDRRLVEGRILDGPPQWEGEEPDEYVRRKVVTSATILGWLELQGCKLSAEARRSLPEMRKADERWRPEWDATVDESHESRGGSVAVNTDASKIIDAPLAQVVPLAIEHTRHPFAEFTEYRPFDGLVKERPFRALSALSYEARNGEYPTRFWQSALTDWPNEVSSRLRCFFAARIVRLPQNVVFDLRYYIPRWFQTNFPTMARSHPSDIGRFGTPSSTISSRLDQRGARVR
jgi:hypothetical protein